ncbi:DNA-3-methyladenine glycosylase family protein [Halovenus rubra]|uniref:DNA-3-methyladenine glycosylase family protein n=2 Tax=Halovenus rubra TaxID=869890 RepID=A0ACC7E0H6_9EURY|nr:DNA-3-methyladenine glycosylase 2 family protein [Halovenus rubra]
MDDDRSTAQTTANGASTTAQQAAASLREDGALEPHIDQHGTLPLKPADDSYQRLVVSLLRQQVSIASAEAVRERLFTQFDVTPETMLAADPDRLASVGLSAAKVEYIKSTARAFQENGYSRESFGALDDEAVREELTEIRGVGPWTAKMFLIYALGRPDVFAVEDLGIRRGIELVCDREMTRGEMVDRAKKWRPYRSYASLYLWRAYEGDTL